MSSLKPFLTSSLGKKYIMALSGMLLCGFLLVHAIGNTTIFWGSEVFNRYTNFLHSLGFFVDVFQIGLLAIFLVHVFTGFVLFLQNRKAKGSRYAVKKSTGGSNIASSTMFYTGLTIIVFTILHLLDFRFVGDDILVFTTVGSVLQNPVYTFIYITAILAMGLHISHGIWSSLQSLGINHPRYNKLIIIINWGVTIFITTVFLFIVLFLFINK